MTVDCGLWSAVMRFRVLGISESLPVELMCWIDHILTDKQSPQTVARGVSDSSLLL